MEYTPEFSGENVLGNKICEFDRSKLCELVSELSKGMKADADENGWRGGVFPGNISLEDDKLAIGSARASEWDGEELEYIAPELYWKGEKSAAADVYSLGLLLYYAVTGGTLPFESETEEEQESSAQQRRVNGEAFELPKDVDTELGEVIKKAASFQAEDRYKSLDELNAALAPLWLEGEELEAVIAAAAAEEPETAEEPEAEPEEAEAPKEETAREPIVILTEEKNPELEPIVPIVPQFNKNVERDRKISEEVRRRRRRPFIVLIILCILLVVTAIVAVSLMDGEVSFLKKNPSPAADQTPTIPTPIPSPTPEPTPAPPAGPTYEIFVEDVSWMEAASRCKEKGGYLVAINDEAELQKVIDLATANNVTMVWVGCQRIDGELFWESGETVEYYPWDASEPSYVDGYDGEAENYVLLWYNNGQWVYNDSRNDPVSYYPPGYAGKIAYVCEMNG